MSRIFATASNSGSGQFGLKTTFKKMFKILNILIDENIHISNATFFFSFSCHVNCCNSLPDREIINCQPVAAP